LLSYCLIAKPILASISLIFSNQLDKDPMADELNKPPYIKGLNFPRLLDEEGKEIEDGDIR